MVIDVDSQGQPSIGGIGLQDLSGLLPGLALPNFSLNPFYVDWLKNTNVQHIELVHTDKGVFLFVNGQAMPSLVWDQESLGNLAEVSGALSGPFGQLLKTLVPILQRTGLNVVLRFPTQDGAAPIELRDATAPIELPTAEAAPADAALHLDVDYALDENGVGVPRIAGLTSRDLMAATGLGLPVELTPQAVQLVKTYGIEEFQVRTAPDGLYLTVNGQPLPHIAWNDAYLQNVSDFYAQMNPASPYINLVKLLLPELNNMDVDLMIRFPS